MRRSNIKYALLLPGLLVIFLTTILPVISVINLSFREWQITRSAVPGPYTGLGNYLRALSDKNFINSVIVTLNYTIIIVFFSIIIGLFCAITLQRDNRIAGIVKAVLIFPFAISLTLRGYSFRFMLLADQGILDAVLDFFLPRFQDIVWLGRPGTALFWLCVPVFWSWGPLSGLMLLGALNNIPRSIFEAARIDGASPLRIFRRITLPLLRPMIYVSALLVTLFSIRMFDIVHTMSAGGPGRSTETLNYLVYRVGFRVFDMGYASALSMIMTLVLIGMAYLYSRILVK